MRDTCFTVTCQGVTHSVAATHRPGPRDLIVLIHGLGCSRRTFSDVWHRPAFAAQALLAVDLPGFGDSSRPIRFSYRLEDHAAVCAVLLERIHARRVHIVAHSMGAAVGLLLAQRLSSRPVSFASLEGNLVDADCGPISRRTAGLPFPRFTGELWPALGKRPDAHRFDFSKTLPWAFYKSAVSLVQWSDSGALVEHMASLGCPAAYFHGSESPVPGIVHRMAGIEPIEIPAGGHFFMNDNPDDFYARLHAFTAAATREARRTT